MSDPELLHIYNQSLPQDDVYIVGNRAGLLRLKAAVELALSKVHHETTAFVNDGEGFGIRAMLLDESWEAENWTRLGVPYSERAAMEQRENSRWPWEFWQDST